MKPLSKVVAGLAVALVLGMLSGTAFADKRTGTRQAGDSCADDDECTLGTICNRAGSGEVAGKVCEALPNGKRILPFYYHQPGEVGQRHVPIGLYFSTWNRDGKTRVQFPFFAQRHDYQEHSRVSVIPPLAAWYTEWKQKGHEGWSAGWMPFFFWRHRGAEKLLALPLLLSGFRSNSQAGVAEAMVLLLGYYRKEPGISTKVLFPLYFDFERDGKRRVVAPLTYLYRDKTHSNSVIFPIVWHFSDSEAGMNHLAIFPLFDWNSANHGRQQRIISWIFGWERNDDLHRQQLVLLTPPFYHRRDTVRDIDALPPIFFRWRIHAERSTTTLVGPFYHSTDPEGTTATLFPIFWSFTDRKTGSQSHFLFPIAGWFSRPLQGKTSAFLGPIYGWKSRDGAGGGILPLIYGGRSFNKIYAMVLPLFFHSHDRVTGSSTTVVGPGYVHQDAHTDGKSGFDAGLVPLLFFGKHQTKEGASNYAVIPGLLFHKQGPDGQTNVVGPAFYNSDKTGWSAGVAPIAFFGKHGGKEHQVIFPIFIRTADREAQKERMLAGLYYHRRDGNETVDSVFPFLYFKHSPEHALLLSPIGGYKRDGDRQTTIVLNYGQMSDPKRQSYTRFFLPIFIQHREPGLKVAVVFPLFWAIQEGAEKDTAFFPFYWRIRSPKMSLDAVFPLVLHWKTKAAEATIVGPFWNRQRTDGGRSTGLFPLFAYGRKVEKDGRSSSYFGMPAFYWDKNEMEGTRNVVLGPFFDHRGPDGYTSGMVPLAFFWRRSTVSKAFILPLLFYRRADSATDSNINVLGPVYWGKDGKAKRFGVAPFLFVKTGGDGTFAATLFPIFQYRQKKLGSVLITPLGGWSTYPGGVRAFFTLFYFRRDPQVSSTAFWPIVYFGKDRTDDSETRLVFPFYFHRRFPSQTTLSLYTPLVWNFHNVERRVVLALPLFFDSHWYGESRATGLLPFFIRYKSQITSSTQWFFPPLLSWYRVRHGEDPGTDVVVFPLVWHYGGKTNSTTVAFPLWFDFKRGASRTQIFMPGIPVYVRWERADAIRYLVFNVYVKKGIGDEKGSWFVDIIPLVNFGRPRKNDITWKVLEGLFGYSRIGRNRILHLFWFWDIPLEPAAPSSLGWWTNTPAAGRTSLF